MKIKRQKAPSRTIFISILIIILVGIIVYGIFALQTSRWPFFSDEKVVVQEVDRADNDSIYTSKDELSKNSATNTDSDSTVTKKTPENNTGSVDTKADDISVTITSVRQNGGNIQINSLIEAVTNDGSCTLTMTNGSRIVTKTGQTQALASSSTCMGFVIPLNELSAGSWQITLDVKMGKKSGSATLEYEVK